MCTTLLPSVESPVRVGQISLRPHFTQNISSRHSYLYIWLLETDNEIQICVITNESKQIRTIANNYQTTTTTIVTNDGILLTTLC